MPQAVVDAALAGDLVVFAGAGVSTESGTVFPYSFYEEIAGLLEIAPDAGPSFPALMSEYEQRFGRTALIERFKERLDYVRSFPELEGSATRFHRELATLFCVKDIVTTNWDDFFETECGATSFVGEKDWVFWRLSKRKVFKIHGSINSPGSMIATEADYERCRADLDEGLLGATLKTMLATKTVVFVGYSLRDQDLADLYSVLQNRMGEFMPKAFVVTIDDARPPGFASKMHVIRTDAAYFVAELKTRLPDAEFIADSRLDATDEAWARASLVQRS